MFSNKYVENTLEECEGVTRSRKSKKVGQYNGKKKQRSNSDLQNTTKETLNNTNPIKNCVCLMVFNTTFNNISGISWPWRPLNSHFPLYNISNMFIQLKIWSQKPFHLNIIFLTIWKWRKIIHRCTFNMKSIQTIIISY